MPVPIYTGSGIFIIDSQNPFYYFTNAFTFSQMLSASSPYFLISSTAGPDSPNVSITPIFRTGVGSFSESTSHTALPSPPMTECSSTVTTFPVSFAAATISSSSIGLARIKVWIQPSLLDPVCAIYFLPDNIVLL